MPFLQLIGFLETFSSLAKDSVIQRSVRRLEKSPADLPNGQLKLNMFHSVHGLYIVMVGKICIISCASFQLMLRRRCRVWNHGRACRRKKNKSRNTVKKKEKEKQTLVLFIQSETQHKYTILATFQCLIIPNLLNISFKKSLCESLHGTKSRTACRTKSKSPTHLASSLNIIIPLTFQRARLSSPPPPFCKFERGNFLKGGIYGSELASHD